MIAERDFSQVEVPECVCGGVLKPDVVFFGDNVPRPTVQRAYALVDEADALLVVGSSLMVFSGLRFVRRALESETPVVIVNRGRTRADELNITKVDADCVDALHELDRRSFAT